MKYPAMLGRITIALTLGLICLSIPAVRADVPIYQREPYDQITLDAANDNTVLQVEPLDLTPKQIASKLKTRGKLIVHPKDSPDKTFEVQWHNIVKLETFGELVLNEGIRLTESGKFDEAYDYYLFLQQKMPNTPGLKEAFEKSLQAEVMEANKNEKFDAALALLRELHRRNPNFPKIDNALGKMTDLLVVRYVEKGDYASARRLLRDLAAAYPEHPIVVQWRERFHGETAPLLAEARAAAEAGQWSKAADLVRRIVAVAPDMPGARELALTAHRKYPRVIVGVCSLAADFTPGRLNDWNARRDSRLIYRTLAEFAGPSIEGGNYICPVGEISSTELGRRLDIKIKPGVRWASGDATLGNADVSMRLLEMAVPGDPFFRLDWADLIGAVSIRGAYGVEVELRRAHVRPEAMLQIVLAPQDYRASSGQPPPPNGPLTVKSRTERETVFAANPQYFAHQPGQPMEIIERRYDTVAQAVRALRRGDIDVLDRLNPWTLSAVRQEGGFAIQPYALPLVHCLVPNPRRPLMNDRTFRRALVYGIHRKAIVEQMLGGAEIPGCVATSSPFPLSTGPNDPMGYASDDRIAPRPYEPRLAIALAGVALQNYIDSKAGKESGITEMPTLVLAHPADEIAAGACASIQLQLKLLGIPVELRPIAGPMPARVPDDVDLLYAELSTWEPVVDARRLLGEDGMAGECSPYMSQALRRLDEAVEWGQVRECLHRVHGIAHADVAVVPLWQVVEHFAYRERIQGIPLSPVSLFQNFEQWRPAFQYPSEK